MIAFLAIYFLLNLFKTKQETINFKELFLLIYSSKAVLLFIVLLMPLNWLIETYKWYLLTNRSQSITFYKSLQSILLGVLFSLLSPNRIGELGGRLVYIKREKLFLVFYTNLFCSFSQLFVTFLLGMAAAIILANELSSYLNFNPLLLMLLALIIIAFSFFIFFYSNALKQIMQFLSNKIKVTNENFFEQISFKSRITVLGLSFLRYAFFSFQFYLVLQIFEVNSNVMSVFAGIALVFFVTALIPTAWISDLPVRGSVAYFVFEQLGALGKAGLLSSIILWSINLLLPALLGLFVLPKVNWMELKKFRP